MTDNIGNFSSSVAQVPAVSATGSNGAVGVSAFSDSSTGVSGQSNTGTGVTAQSNSSFAIEATSFSGVAVEATGHIGVEATSLDPSGIGVRVVANTGVIAQGGNGPGISGQSNSSTGVEGTSDNGTGVAGSGGTNGVQGTSTNGTGVFAQSASGVGVFAQSASGVGVFAHSSGRSPGVVAVSNSGTGIFAAGRILAGQFNGGVDINGTLTKSNGGFQIDHPLDPANKYLFHSFVESPDMKNIYDGVVVLDAQGEAEVTLPTWFEALNTDFRYQLTAIGASGPDLYIAEEMSANRFKIAGGKPHMKVSWQVTGIRQDAFAKAHPLSVEQDKPAQEHGNYRHPELYGESEQKSIVRVRYPELE